MPIKAATVFTTLDAKSLSGSVICLIKRIIPIGIMVIDNIFIILLMVVIISESTFLINLAPLDIVEI